MRMVDDVQYIVRLVDGIEFVLRLVDDIEYVVYWLLIMNVL